MTSISRRTPARLPRACAAFIAAGCCAAAFAADRPVPAAPGSLAPHLARDGGNTLVLSWLEPSGDDHALRFVRWADGGWDDAPQTVATGSDWFVNWADVPAVVPLDGDTWVAHWLKRRPAGGYAYDVYVALSDDGGESFGRAFRPHRDDTDTEHGFVSHFPRSGAAGLVWLDGRRTADGGGMTLRAATVAADGSLTEKSEVDGLVCDCCPTDVTRLPDGHAVVYRNRTEAEVRDIYVARFAGDDWLAPVRVAADDWTINGCPVNGPAVAAQGSELVVAWFTAAADRPRVRLARSINGITAFADPVDVVAGSTVGRVGLVVLDDGSAVVSALESRGNGLAALTLRRVDPDGRVAAPLTIADNVPVFGVPQIEPIAGGIAAAWPARVDGNQLLESAWITEAELN